MDYMSAKEKCTAIQRALVTKRAALTQTEAELSGLGQEKAVLMSRYTAAEAQDRTRALASYKQAAVTELNQQLQRALKHLSSLEQQYSAEKEQLTLEKFEKLYEDDAIVVQDLKDTTSLLAEELERVFGKRVCDVLLKQQENTLSVIDDEYLDFVIEDFKKTILELQENQSDISFFDRILSFFESGMQNISGVVSSNNNATLAFCIISLVLLFLFFKYLAPVYICMITATGAFNIYRSFKLRKTLTMLGAVTDNVEKIEQNFNQKVSSALEESKQELADIFEPRIDKVQNKIAAIKESISATEINAERQFQYEPGQLADSYNNGKLNIDAREATLKKSKETLLQEIKSLEADKEAAQNQLHQITGGIQDTWLNVNQVGTSMMFEPKFLIDIKESKPIFFTHPQRSSLFVYKDSKDVIDFIRLLCLQLRIRLSPFCQEVCIYDAVNLGMDFNVFMHNSNDYLSESLFKIISDDQAFLKYLEECRDDVIRRSNLLNKENMDIQAYNSYMLEQEGLTESYVFCFLIDPPSSVLENVRLHQILASASRVGVLFHIFIREDVFYKVTSTAENLLDKVERSFVVTEGKVMGRAIECMLDNIKQAQEKH